MKGLSRELLIETGLLLLDEVGLDGLSVRRLAAELDVHFLMLAVAAGVLVSDVVEVMPDCAKAGAETPATMAETIRNFLKDIDLTLVVLWQWWWRTFSVAARF